MAMTKKVTITTTVTTMDSNLEYYFEDRLSEPGIEPTALVSLPLRYQGIHAGSALIVWQ